MISNQLPSVLQASNSGNSLSMERALKQIDYLLKHCIIDAGDEDKLLASIDDVTTMLRAVNRD